MDQCTRLLRTSIMPGRGIIYWYLQWDVPLGWVSYLYPSVRATAQSPFGSCCPAVETHYTWNGRGTTERGKKVGILVSHFPHPEHLTSESAATSSQHVMICTRSGQVPKAASTLTSKDQATSVILIKWGDLPVQVPTKYLSFQPYTSVASVVSSHEIGT